MNDKKTLIIIPTYNESKNIRKITDEIFRLNLNIDILIVDDNSPDGTGNMVDEMSKENGNIKLIRREAKLGLDFKEKEEKNYLRRG